MPQPTLERALGPVPVELGDEAPPAVSRQKRADIVVVTLLVGICALGLSAYGVVSNSLNRIDSAFASMNRIEAPIGAPDAASDPSGPKNYTVFAVNPDGSLSAALVVHLTASREELTAVAIPADLSLPDGSVLASAFETGIPYATKSLEQVVGVRMDHQFLLQLGECTKVVAAVGGISIGSVQLDADRAYPYLTGAPTSAERANRLAQAVAATMSTFSMFDTLLDPGGFEQTLAALQPCLWVDESVTSEEVRKIISGMRLRRDTIGSVVWPPSHSQQDRVKPDEITNALMADDFSLLPLDYPTRRR